MNIEVILFISAIVILSSISIVVSYKKKQKAWNKIQPGTIVYYLYVNPYSGQGSIHKTEVTDVTKDTICLDHIGLITKKQFFNGTDNMEFIYL